jgi:hypothetical protein
MEVYRRVTPDGERVPTATRERVAVKA